MQSQIQHMYYRAKDAMDSSCDSSGAEEERPDVLEEDIKDETY